jgi:hypothetical protein
MAIWQYGNMAMARTTFRLLQDDISIAPGRHFDCSRTTFRLLQDDISVAPGRHFDCSRTTFRLLRGDIWCVCRRHKWSILHRATPLDTLEMIQNGRTGRSGKFCEFSNYQPASIWEFLGPNWRSGPRVDTYSIIISFGVFVGATNDQFCIGPLPRTLWKWSKMVGRASPASFVNFQTTSRLAYGILGV